MGSFSRAWGAKPVSRLAVVAVVLLVPATALAHAYVMRPPSRDVGIANLDQRAHKTGPCGGSPRTGMPTAYDAGATINVRWHETIDHRGCYQIAFSPAGDKDWVTLKQVNDPVGGGDAGVYNTQVTLPAGVSCKDCTLVVRQLMIGRACEPNEPPPANNTYFSCADIRVGSFPDGGATMPPDPEESDAGGGEEEEETTSGGPTTVPTDGGGKTTGSSSGGTRRLQATDEDSGGCSVGRGVTGSLALVPLAALGLLAVGRRRRRR
jgi:MYXO-CTERM domain-containing protein